MVLLDIQNSINLCLQIVFQEFFLSLIIISSAYLKIKLEDKQQTKYTIKHYNLHLKNNTPHLRNNNYYDLIDPPNWF